MISVFYIAQILNAICIVCILGIILSVTTLFINYCSKLFDGDEKSAATRKKANKVACWVLAVSILARAFIPDGDTYLKMKFGEERLEILMDVIDNKVFTTIENTDLIDYE